MLTIPDQLGQTIVDDLNESPNGFGFLSSCKGMLRLLKELVGLPLTRLHICVTSRLEIDIQNALGPLASHQISLYDQSGQKKDIVDFIRSVVYSDSEQAMKGWKTSEKEDTIEKLSDRVDGV